jgi:gamma-glutamyltranspeptidase / glutathione hydrolase
MKRLAVACVAVFAAMPLSAGSVAIAQHAALATASPYATHIGLDVMKRGGNAIDAAVAVALALAVAHPQAGNLGGGGFLVYYEAATHSVWTLDFREVAPAAAKPDMFGGGGKSSRDGALAAGVPGTVAGLAAMHARFGKSPWKDLVAPAIRLAEEGVRISADQQNDVARAKKARNIEFVGNPASPFVQKELAATLHRLAEKGANDFYDGEIAARMVDGVRAAGGILALRDLRDYKAVWRAPIRVTFREFDLYTLPPPSAAGLMIGEELNILSGFDLKGAGYQTPRSVHLMAEASRRAAIDRDRYLGDPATLRMPYRDLLSPERGKQWRASIDPARATPTISLTEPASTIAEGTHTTHFSIIDQAGNVAAVTTSLGDDFGSGFVVPQCGFLLNNAMHDFASGERSPNALAGSRRMATSVAPTIILRRGQPFLVLGTSGGAAIPNIVLQTFLAVGLYGKSLPDAVAAARCDQQATPEDIRCEHTKTPAETISRLRAMGHGVLEGEAFGDIQALMIDAQRITAVSDPRHGGAAGGL